MIEPSDISQPLIATAGSIAFLLWLVLRLKMSAFLALILASIVAAIGSGIAPMTAIETIKNGMGGTLGFIAVVVGLGSIFGALLQAGGGIEALANMLTGKSGNKATGVYLGLLGFVIAMPVFFDVAIIILAPMIFGMAQRTKAPAMRFALPLLAGLATAHAFIPPTPGPMAVAELLGANIGLVAGFGLLAGLPAMLVAGPLWTRFAEKKHWLELDPAGSDACSMAVKPTFSTQIPASRAITAILFPIGLIVVGALAPIVGAAGAIIDLLSFFGHPFVALLIGCGLAYAIFRPDDPVERAALRAACEKALEPAGAVILITGAGGAFKQVLVETGAGAAIANGALGAGLTPLLAGFLIALIVRAAQGSATVAMITSAGLTAPMVAAAALSPAEGALVVIAIASGATALSHVNDSGFWLVSRYFNLSPPETLRLWTTCSTLVGFTGFLATCLLALLID